MPESHEGSARRTPRDFLRVLFRRRWLFLLGTTLSALGVLVGAHYLPVQYTGTAMFERRVDPAMGATGGGSESFATLRHTLRNELAGYRAVEQAIEKLGLTQNLPRTPDGELTPEGQMRHQALIQDFMAKAEIGWKVRSNEVDLISLSFTHPDPQLAQQVPNTLVHDYMAMVSHRTIQRLEESRRFLQDQVEKCARQHETLRRELIQFEQEHEVADLRLIQEQVRRLNSEIDAVRRQHEIALKRQEYLEQVADTDTQPSTNPSTQPVETTKIRNPKLDQLQDELEAAELQLDNMLSIHLMKESHPAVQQQTRIIEQIQRRIEQTPEWIEHERVYRTRDGGPTALEMELTMARSEVSVTAKEVERLEAQLESYKSMLANYAPIRQQYEEKQQALTEIGNEMSRWQAQFQKVQMQLEAEAASRRTRHESVMLAQPQFSPSRPSLLMVLGAALAGGLAAGAGLVFLAHLLDRTFSTTDDAGRYFDVPIFGVIGEITTRRQQVRNRLKKWLMVPVVSFVLLAAIGLSSMSLILWLKYPQEHKRWKAAPVGYLRTQAGELVSRING